MASGYDITINLHQHHVIERRMLLLHTMYFVVVTLLFQLLAKHSSAALNM